MVVGDTNPLGAEKAGIGIQESKATIVEYNKISNLDDSGIDVFFENDSIVRYNYIENVSGAFYPHGSNLTFFGNIINLTGRPRGAGMNIYNPGKRPIYILHNTIYLATGYVLATGGVTSTGPVIFRNNIIDSSGNSALTEFSNISNAWNISSEYNCYYNIDSPLKFLIWNGTASRTFWGLSSWQTTGFDTSSIAGDPNFNLTSGFHLSSNSPCKDNGTDVSSMIGFPYKDYYGTTIPQGSAPDIGAVEG